MIHELRTYTLLPKKAPEFLKLTRKVGFEIRSKHSKCLGYWTSEIGDLNQVVHLWEYEDFARVYGYDIRQWPGYRVMCEVREFLMVTWVMQKAPEDDWAAAEAAKRITALRTGASRKDWQPS